MFTSCQTEGLIKTNTPSEELVELLTYPELYYGKETILEGLVKSVNVRNINKDLAILVIKLVPQENPTVKKKKVDETAEKFPFHQIMKEANELFSCLPSVAIGLNKSSAPGLEDITYEFKFAARRLEAFSYLLSECNKQETAEAFTKIASAFAQTSDAYITFKNISLIPDIQVSRSENLENKLYTGAQLLNDVADGLLNSKYLLMKGLYTFEYEKIFNPHTSFKLQAHSSMLAAQSWTELRLGNKQYHTKLQSLSHAFDQLAQANKKLNDGISDLGKALNKTAISWSQAKDPALKCAYFGYNGSHLVRCSQLLASLNSTNAQIPIKIKGKLIRSDLREEVNVVWFQAEGFEVDGLKLSLNYGDESGAMKSTVELYEWVEDVEKGSK